MNFAQEILLLCWILKSSHERAIIPVFCDVEPHDLRYIDQGPFAVAFQEHQRKGKVAVAVMNDWKEALRKTADISGLVFRTNESEHGEFLEEIVKIVLREIKWDPLEVATYPVGLDQAIEDFQNKIDLKQSATKVVGIVGIGGIGKSTLAKHLFNLKRSDFNRSSYLSRVREKIDLPSLQRQLFRDLLGVDMHIVDTDFGRSIARNSLGGLKALIVLDDVDDGSKLKSLLHLDGVGHGSLILITSRDKDIFNGSCANPLLYEVKPMGRKHAQELFCRHAFHQPKPFEGYEDLVEQFLEILGGLPLSLKVLGEQLAGKLDKTHWKRQLEKYFQGLPLPEAKDVINTLKWSYNAMRMEEKMMFMDIGCFLEGEDTELAVRVLEGLGYYNDVRDCLQTLRQKCLVDVDNNEIDNSSEGRRNADGSDFCRIRGIRIPKGQDLPKLNENLNIKGLRLLVVEHPIDLSRFFCSAIFGDLIWLRLHNCGFMSIPSTVSLRSLRVLELQGPRGNIEQIFNRIDEIPWELSELSVDNRLITSASTSSSSVQPVDFEHPNTLSRREISTSSEKNISKIQTQNFSRTQQRVMPTFISSTKQSAMPSVISSTQQQGKMPSFFRFLQWIGTFLTNLGKIELKNIISLRTLPIEFSALKILRHLDLSGCIYLTKLPNSFSHLLQLQYLALRNCKNLSIPKDILGEISTLEYVDFQGCAQLVQLPLGMAHQTSLRYLKQKYHFCSPEVEKHEKTRIIFSRDPPK